jgi:two-component system, sensor histidine kinase and response regulator
VNWGWLRSRLLPWTTRQRLDELVDERTRQLRQQLEAQTGRAADLKALNRQLAETERFMRLVTDNIPARLAYWDRERRCLFVNRAGHANWGKRREDFIGRTSKEIFGQDFIGPNERYSAAALRGEPQDFEREERTPTGEKVVMWLHYEPDIRDGQVVGFFSLATDVTRTRVAERQLREINEQLLLALDRAEAGSRAKSMFLSNMSHEIRTPMNAIIGLTHLLRGDIVEPAQSERLGKVADAADHLLRIINDILDLAKIESSQLRLEATDFSLEDVLARATSLVADEARAKGLELVMAAEPVPDRLHGDPTRLVQALLNLLGNAIKFTDRGRVTLSVALLSSEPPQVMLRFEVRDTGIGIEPAQLETLFTPFQQADNSTTRRFGGTGLGLAITKRIAEVMGGVAGADSTPGVGSRFWFTARLTAAAPVAAAPAQAAPQAAAQPRWPRARVLLAEDNRVNRELAVELLRTAAIVPDVAVDGVEAVRMARTNAYDLVLMDVQMPGLDGLQATRELRRSARVPDVPIIALTASAFAEDREACLAAGMNDHIAKPIDPLVLYRALQRWMPVPPAPA